MLKYCPVCDKRLEECVCMKREHIMGKNCWCHPRLDYSDPVTGAEVWVHNEGGQN
mgnify:FL=1